MTTAIKSSSEQLRLPTDAAADLKSTQKKNKKIRQQALKDSAKILKSAPQGVSQAYWEQISSTISKIITNLIRNLSDLINSSKTNLKSNPTESLSATTPNNKSLTEDTTTINTGSANTEENITSSKTQTIQPRETQADTQPALRAVSNSNNTQSIYTQDGYVLTTEGKDEAFTITDPEGKTTRIWGDPHLNESDADKWDFKERSTFIFGKNKLTVETIAADQNTSLSSKITIYNGDMRATISGIDKNKPVLDIIKSDRILDDSIREDGDLFIMTKEQFGDDKFVLVKDSGEKFDPKFEKKVGVGEVKIFDTILTDEQKKLLGK